MNSAPMSVNRIIFTGDILKVDDSSRDRTKNPQTINIDWIEILFAPIVAEISNLPWTKITGNETNTAASRTSLFRTLGLNLTTASWASLYDGLDSPSVANRLKQEFDGALVISFELPPYLERLLSDRGIPYIDLSIHPLRFLPDYLFGVRTNSQAIHRRLVETSVEPDIFKAHARWSRARSARVYRQNRPQKGSAVFFGQTEVDSSIVANRTIATFADTKRCLTNLSLTAPVVYYKKHPHLKDDAPVQDMLNELPRCELLDANVYDTLAADEVSVFASLSSGTLEEAKAFGQKTRRFLPNENKYDIEGMSAYQNKNKRRYVPVPPAILSKEYWNYLFGYTNDVNLQRPTFDSQVLKFALTQRWGR